MSGRPLTFMRCSKVVLTLLGCGGDAWVRGRESGAAPWLVVAEG